MGTLVEWNITETAPGELLLEREGKQTRAFVADAGATRWVFIAGRTWEIQALRQSSGPAGALAAPMPATVIRILAKPGAAVRKGETLILLEAMKMELPLRAPQDGTVQAVRCREGELVQPGRVLVDLK
jgi:3-methylcrotonyl-CoA carboxylase alpha subunit